MVQTLLPCIIIFLAMHVYLKMPVHYDDVTRVYCRHFMATDSKKFQDVWCMNEEEAKELVNKILEQDRILHEVQMGIPWEAPDV